MMLRYMKRSGTLTLILLLLVGSIMNAQTARLRGTVFDPSGAVIPAATITVSRGSKIVVEGNTDATGNFLFELAPGNYRLEVTAPDFMPRQQNVRLTPNTRPLSISLALAAVNEAVDVAATDDRVSLDQDANLTSTIISGDAVKDLPEDEDALMAQLRSLASGGGAAGTTATLVVDGFVNGQLPLRDQIQQIIIDQNVFSAANRGGPRIQIITKSGGDSWRGNVNLDYNDQSLNARNPLDANRPKKQQHSLNMTYGGPVIPGKLTMRFSARTLQRDQEGTSILAVTQNGKINQGVFSPTRNQHLNLNGQLSLTRNNTLNFGVNYNINELRNQGIGGFTLAERATNFKGHNWTVNLRERAIVNPRLISELRFSIFHNQNSLLPVTEAIAINVLDSFNSGGAQNRTRRRGTNYDVGNTIRWTAKPNVNLEIGTDFSANKNYSSSETDYFGVFTFSSLDDYLSGRPVTFRKTTGDPVVNVGQLEFETFVQADWRVNKKLNLGAGARYEVQQNLHDYNNLAPTFQIAYQPWSGTVLRAGGRLSYATYPIANTETVRRQGGSTHQVETVILNPSYPDPFANSSSSTTTTNNASIRTRDAKLVAPYTINSAVTLEKNLKRGWRFSTSLDITRGVHIIRTRNINAPYPGTPLPEDLFDQLNSFNPAVQAVARDQVDRMRPLYPNIGNVYQFESTGESFSKNVGVRVYTPDNFTVHRVGIRGLVQYTLGWAYDDSSAVNQYDWRPDWALSSSDVRHRFTTNLSLKFPKDASLSVLIFANSGRPYSLTTGRDNNGDQTTNDRPFGVPRNSLTGPGSYTVTTNFIKRFALRKPEQSQKSGSNAASDGIKPRTQKIIRGREQPPGPNLEFNVSVNNLLNNAQLRGYSGVLTSPLFGKPTGAAAGRTIMLGLGVSF
jgi:Carboxypeptidase regulatory-like domain